MSLTSEAYRTGRAAALAKFGQHAPEISPDNRTRQLETNESSAHSSNAISQAFDNLGTNKNTDPYLGPGVTFNNDVPGGF